MMIRPACRAANARVKNPSNRLRLLRVLRRNRSSMPPSLHLTARGNIEVLIAQQRLNVAVARATRTPRGWPSTPPLITTHCASWAKSSAHDWKEFPDANRSLCRGQTDRMAVATARLLEQELKPHLEEFRRAYRRRVAHPGTGHGRRSGPHMHACPSLKEDLEFTDADLDVDRETNLALKNRADLRLARLLVRAARRRSADHRSRLLSFAERDRGRPLHSDHRFPPGKRRLGAPFR